MEVTEEPMFGNPNIIELDCSVIDQSIRCFHKDMGDIDSIEVLAQLRRR